MKKKKKITNETTQVVNGSTGMMEEEHDFEIVIVEPQEHPVPTETGEIIPLHTVEIVKYPKRYMMIKRWLIDILVVFISLESILSGINIDMKDDDMESSNPPVIIYNDNDTYTQNNNTYIQNNYYANSNK